MYKIITCAHGHRLRDTGVRTTRCNLFKTFDHPHERGTVLSPNGGFIESPIMCIYLVSIDSLGRFGRSGPRPKCGWSRTVSGDRLGAPI